VKKITIDATATTDGIVINGGSNNGLIKIDKLTQKLNELVQVIATHKHLAPGGATGTPLSTLPTFNKIDYEVD